MVQKRLYLFTALFFVSVLLAVTFNNCAQHPQVVDSAAKIVSFEHSQSVTSCTSCHIPDRPTSSPFVHYNNQDCVTCHYVAPATWSQHSWHFRNPGQPTCAQCHQKDQPAAVSGIVHYNNQDCVSCHQAALTAGVTWASLKTYTHTPLPTLCATCHEKDRLSPTHNAGKDCVQCHTPTAW